MSSGDLPPPPIVRAGAAGADPDESPKSMMHTAGALCAGPTHLNALEHLEEEVGVPGSLEPPSLDALALDGLLS